MRRSRTHRDHCRNRVLEDQLFLVIGFEHQGVLIKALDAAGEFNAAQEVDRNDTLFFARIIEKAVLYVLRWFVHV